MILTVTPNPCIDKAIWFDDVRLGLMNKGRKSDEVAGGKGNNVSRVLKALGHEVASLNLLCGYTGRRILELLEADGVNPVPIWAEGLSRVITTIRGGEGLDGTELADSDPVPSAGAIAAFVDRALELAAHADYVVLSGSVPGPGEAGRSIYRAITSGLRARGSGTPVFLDANGPALADGLAAGPDYCKPNSEEIQALLGETASQEDIIRAPRHFLQALAAMGVSNPIISLGESGAVAMHGASSTIYRARPPKVDAVNPVGSGDSFVAGFIHGLAVSGGDTGEALRWATAAGSANARQWRAGSVSEEDVVRLLDGVSIERVEA